MSETVRPPDPWRSTRPGIDEHYRSVFKTMLNGLAYCKVLTDSPPPHDFVYLEVNDAFETLTGLKGVTGKRVTEVIPGIRELDPWVLDLYSEVAETGQPRRLERHVKALNEWFSVSVYSPAKGYFVAVFDVTTKARMAEEELRASEERYRTLVKGMPAGLILQLADGTLAECNPAAERILGLSAEDMRGRKSTDPSWGHVREDGSLLPGEEHAPMVALRTGMAQTDAVMGFTRPDGTVTWVSINSEPLRDRSGGIHAVLSTFVDVTQRRNAEIERKRLQDQLARTARLAAMGTLVAGVAHEINNPLTAEIACQGIAAEAIQDARRKMEERLPLDRDGLGRLLDEAEQALADAQASGQRVARIVRDLAALSSPIVNRTRVALGDVVEDAVRWLPPSVTRAAAITVEKLGLAEALATAGQIQQVVANLITNAAKAIPLGERGEISVQVGPGTSGMARVEVRDNGVGMTPDVMQHIFDPFFTTRKVGEGMGLGLPICEAIVNAHGGTITVSSAPGRGSTFRMELPVAPREA